MVLDLINLYKEKYKMFILEGKDYDELYKWESLKNFQDNWNIDADNFLEMYDKSLSNEISANLWASQFFFPKSAMLEFIKLDSERVRNMFRELFNETLDIEKRIDHFVFNCDEMRDEVLKENPSFKNHFHDGFRIISVYLSFRYPMNYSIYKYTEFKTFMTLIRAKSIPSTGEINRFFKVMRTIYNIISKDTELQKIHQELRKETKYYKGDSLLLAQDLYWCTRYDLDRFKVSIKK